MQFDIALLTVSVTLFTLKDFFESKKYEIISYDDSHIIRLCVHCAKMVEAWALNR